MGYKAANDGYLLRRIAAGDDEAFRAFYVLHLSSVIAFFRRRVPHAELAFDLTAESFAAMVTGAQAREGDGPAAAWLFVIARNKLRNSFRRGSVEAAARTRLGLERIALDDRDIELVDDHANDGATHLTELLAELPEPTRRALLARVLEERRYPDIAAELRNSDQVVRKRARVDTNASRSERTLMGTAFDDLERQLREAVKRTNSGSSMKGSARAGGDRVWADSPHRQRSIRGPERLGGGAARIPPAVGDLHSGPQQLRR